MCVNTNLIELIINSDKAMSFMSMLISALSLIAVIVMGVASWHKNRVIYGLDELVLRKFDGSKADSERGLSKIKEKLKTGKYKIESIQERKDGDWAILLSQIKK